MAYLKSTFFVSRFTDLIAHQRSNIDIKRGLIEIKRIFQISKE